MPCALLLLACLQSIPACNEQQPDPETMQFCGGAQNTCEMIVNPGSCNGTRQQKEAVTPNCVPGACYLHCTQKSVLCYTEYTCLWDSEHSKCVSDVLTQTGNTMAKTNADCRSKIGCVEN